MSILTNPEKNIRFGIDYLRLNFDRAIPYYENILRNLDFDNSNFQVDENGFMYQKVQLKMGPALLVSVVYENKPVPFMMYNVFQSIKSKYARIDFYGSYFRLEEIGFFELGYYRELIEELTQEDPSISRIDYCFDLFYAKKTAVPTFKSLFGRIDKGAKLQVWKKGDDLQSRMLGSSSAKRCVIRLYDKLVDLGVKGKFFLYGDYLKWASVHRFEVQFGPSFTRGYKLSYLDELVVKVAKIMGITSIGSGTLFYQYSDNYEINSYSKLVYTKQLVGRSMKFFDSGLNPYTTLLTGIDTEIGEDQSRLLEHKKFLLELWLKLKDHRLLIDLFN